MAQKLIMIGLLRFSVLTPTYYSKHYDTLEKTAAHLFSPERMALRFRIFEQLCLPSLVRQTDQGFDAVVLTAETLPAAYLDRLTSLLAPYPNLHVLQVGTENHYQLLKGGYDSVDAGDATHRILFRLDDDDALDMEFVARTKRLAHGLMAVQTDPDSPFIIAYHRGYYIKSTDGENEVFDACERAALSAGTTLVAPVGHGHNPYRFNHRRLAQHFNTYSDISVPGFLRTIHGDNKSNPTLMGLTHKMKPAKIDAELQAHFGVSLETLKAL